MGSILSTAALVLAPIAGTAPIANAAEPPPAPPSPPPEDGSVPPPGANDWNCKPTAEHPRAVVLVHGTYGNMNRWNVLSPELKADGYCVFALNYGKDPASLASGIPGYFAVADIAKSAGELAVYVDEVLAATGTDQVDIVAHSQGGPMSRQYLKFNGGTDPADPADNKVLNLITLVGTNHGTTISGLSNLAAGNPVAGDAVAAVFSTAVRQQLVGSPFMTELNAGGDTQPGVHYTAVGDRVDMVSTPPEATFLTAGPGATVHNVWVQSLCPGDMTAHGNIPSDPAAAYIVLSALDPGYAASHTVFCPPPSSLPFPMPAL